MKAEELVGQTMADYRVEKWFRQWVATGETGGHYGDYFKDRDLAIAAGKGKSWFGDRTVSEVYVLTKDGVTGIALDGDEVTLADEPAIRAEVVAKAAEQLTPEQLRLLQGVPAP